MFLTRKEYDAQLPMSSEKQAAYLRATRIWKIEGVQIVFANATDRETFLRG